MSNQQPVFVDDDSAYCNGGLGSLGHPRVYLPMGPEGIADCPYCGQRYILKGSPGERQATSSQEETPAA